MRWDKKYGSIFTNTVKMDSKRKKINFFALLSSNRINKSHIFVFIAFYKILQLFWGYEVIGLIKIHSCDLLYSQSASWSYNTSSRSPFRRALTMQHLKSWRKMSLLYQAAAARVLILVCCHFVYVTNINFYTTGPLNMEDQTCRN